MSLLADEITRLSAGTSSFPGAFARAIMNYKWNQAEAYRTSLILDPTDYYQTRLTMAAEKKLTLGNAVSDFVSAVYVPNQHLPIVNMLFETYMRASIPAIPDDAHLAYRKLVKLFLDYWLTQHYDIGEAAWYAYLDLLDDPSPLSVLDATLTTEELALFSIPIMNEALTWKAV